MEQRIIGIDLAIRGQQVAQIFDDGLPASKPLRFGIDPTELRRFVASVSEYTKTDLADAHLLGAVPNFGGRIFDPVHIPTPTCHALQRLSKQRHRYREQVNSSRRRLLDLIRWAAPALEGALPDITSNLGLALLAEYFHPDRIRQARRDVLRRFIARHASGRHPHGGLFVEDLITGLKVAARKTLVLHGTRVDFEALQFEVRQEVELLRLHLRQIASLEAQINARYRELDPQALLTTIPGIGENLAPLIHAVVGDVHRFASQRRMRGFCGLFPSRSASGGIEKPGQRITQGGNDRLKRALFLAADTARKIEPQLAEVYWRMMVVKGHHHKQALCAVANRLVNRIYRVLKTGSPYELRAPDGELIDVTTAKQIVRERFTVPETIRAARRRNMESGS